MAKESKASKQSNARKSAPPAPSARDLLGQRLMRVINSPAAQKAKRADLIKLEGDSADDWNEIIAAIEESDNVTVAHRDDGVTLFWTFPKED